MDNVPAMGRETTGQARVKKRSGQRWGLFVCYLGFLFDIVNCLQTDFFITFALGYDPVVKFAIRLSIV